jgi:hypothetical protein
MRGAVERPTSEWGLVSRVTPVPRRPTARRRPSWWRSKLFHRAVDGAVRHPAIDPAGRRVAVEDEAVPALGDDVEDISRPDLEVLRASEAKNRGLLIEIGGRMDEVCESCHKVF